MSAVLTVLLSGASLSIPTLTRRAKCSGSTRNDLYAYVVTAGANAELLHEPKHVSLHAVLDELAVGEAIESPFGDGDLLACRRHAHEVACVRAGEAGAREDAIADLVGLVEGVLPVGEGRIHHLARLRRLLLGAGPERRGAVVLDSDVGGPLCDLIAPVLVSAVVDGRSRSDYLREDS